MTSKMHWVYQALVTVAHAVNLFAGVVPPKYQAFVAFALALLNAGLGLYNHYFTPAGARIAAAIALFFLLALPGFAQTPIFSVSTQAVAIRIGGQTVAGTDAVGSFNLTPNLLLQSDNVLAPANNLQGYYGGLKYYAPFLSKPFAKTNLSSVKPYVHTGFGIVRNVPATGATQQHYSVLADGGFDYAVNGTLSVGPRIGYLNAAGFGSSPHGAIVSASLTILLGKK